LVGGPEKKTGHALLRNSRGVASSPLGCALDIIAEDMPRWPRIPDD
jgi:hypothetical protein